MDETLVNMLHDGICEEIAHYEQLLELTTREHKILAEENYTSELAALAAKKLRIMREINNLGMRIGPLKVRWKLEEAQAESGAGDKGISPLLDELTGLLERILDVDKENQRILCRVVGVPDTERANGSLNAASAAQAYGQTTQKG